MPMRDSKAGELEADKDVLDRTGNVVGCVITNIMNHAEPYEDREEEALPVREKYDELDAKELVELSTILGTSWG